MVRLIATLMLLLAPAFARAEGAASFTPAQRAEIVGIIRDALRSDPSILRDAILALRQDETAKQEAASRAAVANVGAAIANADDPVAGNPSGDVTVVEFYDLRCPYCRS